MAAKKEAAPRLTGAQVKELRKGLHLSQAAFWSVTGTTQSGSSRYESGRSIPRPTEILLRTFYLGQSLEEAIASVTSKSPIDLPEILKNSKDAEAAVKALRKLLKV